MSPISLPRARGMQFLRWSAVASLAVLLAPVTAWGQELGLVAVRASSGNPELPAARGVGAFLALEAGAWQTRLTWLRYGDDTEKMGTVCKVYSPRIGCRAEGVSTSARLSGVRLTVMRSVALGPHATVGAGVGASFNAVSATSVGESGQRADLQMPNTGQIGYLGAGSVSVAPFPGVPVRLVGVALGHWIRFNGCADPEDRTSGYAPFCGWDRFLELQFGASVVIPRS